nr:ISL3 family transposase [Streptomyces chartreusis]
MHGYHWRTVADVPVDGRRVVVRVRVRCLVCPTRGCRHTFREQVPGVLERYQRRTARLTRQVKAVVKELAGRAGSRLLAILPAGLSRHTALRVLVRIPLPAGRVPRVIGVDDFALRRRHRYATLVIDAEAHERIDVLPDRTAGTLEAWLRGHPGVEVVCRDGSTTYAEAIRRALPDAVQVADRWHLWHNLCESALSEVKAHSTCWAAALDAPIYDGPRAQTTLERWHQVHGLLERGWACSMRPPVATRPEHRQTLRASRPARAHAPRPQIPREPRRPLSRAPAQTPGRGPRLPRSAPLRGNQGSRIHRLPKPPGQVHQPGPRGRRPRPHLPAQTRPNAADQARQPQGRAPGTPGQTHRRLRRDDPTGRSHQGFRPAPLPSRRQCRRAHALGSPGPRCRPASPACFHPRSGTRPRGRGRSAHASVQQRPHRGCQHQDQTDRVPDARTSRIRSPPPPHSPRIL